jgi:uncharacterized protein (DUF433 family)
MNEDDRSARPGRGLWALHTIRDVLANRARLNFILQFNYDTHMNTQIIASSPEVMGGTPVFAGTRVPVETLIDYIKGGESIDDFLDGFPTVTRELVIAFLEVAQEQITKMVA